jgi:hypothetical protein
MPHKERTSQRCVIALKEVSKKERETHRSDQEDHKDNIGYRRVEVGEKLPLKDGSDVLPVCVF